LTQVHFLSKSRAGICNGSGAYGRSSQHKKDSFAAWFETGV
jgi:hypothetical protein